MKIILNILTHGDETAGIKVAEEISKLKLIKGKLIITRANELAYKKRKRFMDQDLNRSFPGKVGGNHEQNLAAKILPKIKSADLVIDVHTTKSGLKDSLIVTKLNKKTCEYIDAINPKYLLKMSATKNNALISNAKIGIAFEYGKNKEKSTINNTILGIKKLLSHLRMIEQKFSKQNPKIKWFDVYKSVPKSKGAKLLRHIKNFKFVHKGEKYALAKGKPVFASYGFYPILFGKNTYKEIFGFAARAISARSQNQSH